VPSRYVYAEMAWLRVAGYNFKQVKNTQRIDNINLDGGYVG